jgi:hypothetical protein
MASTEGASTAPEAELIKPITPAKMIQPRRSLRIAAATISMPRSDL